MKTEKIKFADLEITAFDILISTSKKLSESKPENVRYTVKSSKGELGSTHASFTAIELIREEAREDRSIRSEYITTLLLSESGVELDPADEFHTITANRCALGGVLDYWVNTEDGLKDLLNKYGNIKIFTKVSGKKEELCPKA